MLCILYYNTVYTVLQSEYLRLSLILDVDGHHVHYGPDVRERLEHREELAAVLRVRLLA